MDPSTIPRWQKTCAGVAMAQQVRILARIASYCSRVPPLTVHHHLKFDQATVSTALAPGGNGRKVKSAWSVLVVRGELQIRWSSGAKLTVRLVYPPVPLISSGADQLYYGLAHHPSYYAINHLIGMVSARATVRCSLHEVDGAYANLRLHQYLLSLDAYSAPGGCHLESARSQLHATHLTSVSMLAMLGGNLLSRLYAFSVFCRNLGYLLRLQIAVKEWIADAWQP